MKDEKMDGRPVVFKMEIQTKGPTTLEKFKSTFWEFSESLKPIYQQNNLGLRFWDATNIQQVGNSTFVIFESAAEYHSYDNIPFFMRYIIIDKFLDKNQMKYDFEVIGFDVCDKE